MGVLWLNIYFVMGSIVYDIDTVKQAYTLMHLSPHSLELGVKVFL